MHEEAVRRLDRAALALIQALQECGEELKPYLEPNLLECLQKDVVNLRRALLGLEMGPLYWEAPADVIDVIASQVLTVEEAAARVNELMNQRKEKGE